MVSKFLKRLGLTVNQISGNAEGMGFAISISDGYAYENGNKTDNITHSRILAVFPDNNFEQLTVKVMTLDIPDVLKDLSAGKPVKVKFIGLKGKIYQASNGDPAVSVSADAVEVMK